MADVYETAHVTLGAAHASNGTEGLYSKPHLPHKELGPGWGLFVKPLSRPCSDTDSLPLPLLRRAWVFQERRVSRRYLYFGPDCLLWECKSGLISQKGAFSKYESFYGSLLNSQIDTPGFEKEAYTQAEEVMKFWHEAVESYSMLEITKVDDRLPAISAVVKRQKEGNRTNDRYIAGMWESTFLEDLDWEVDSAYSGKGRSCPENIPSWSWASTRGAVTFHTWESGREPVLLEETCIGEITCKNIGPAHMGEVEYASLAIKGRIARASIDYSVEPWEPGRGKRIAYSLRKTTSNKSLAEDMEGWIDGKLAPDYDCEFGEPRVEDGTQLLLLAISCFGGTTRGIALRMVPESESYYQRIGRFTLLGDDELGDIATWPLEDVTIV